MVAYRRRKKQAADPLQIRIRQMELLYFQKHGHAWTYQGCHVERFADHIRLVMPAGRFLTFPNEASIRVHLTHYVNTDELERFDQPN